MDITQFVAGYREAAFLVGDYGSYRAQLTRRLRIVQKKLGRATPKNAKYAAKTPVTAADIAANARAHMGVASYTTVQGETLTLMKSGKGGWVIKDGKGTMGMITTANVMQSNGVIHVIDTVMMP